MIIEAREDTITLRGAVKTNMWPAIQAAAALLLENNPKGIIIDCSTLTEHNAKGAETFSDALDYITSRSARIVISGLSPELLEIVRSVPGVRSQVPLATDVEQARASFELEETVVKRGKAHNATVVPMIGNWQNAVKHANALAVGEDCEIHLVDVIKVSRTLPIGTPLPERETEGKKCLEEAASLVQNKGLKSFTHVERVRSYPSGLDAFIQRLNGNFVVISADKADEGFPALAESEALSLLETATFDLALVKTVAKNEINPSTNVLIPAVGEWRQALKYACKLLAGQGATIDIINLITIPRSEPIDAPRPDEEAVASDYAKEAAQISKKYGAKVNWINERVRDPILGFRKFFAGGTCGMVIVGIRNETDEDYPVVHAIAVSLIHDPPCETVFLRVDTGSKRA
jgi:anti-anti-sigma regulatory factor